MILVAKRGLWQATVEDSAEGVVVSLFALKAGMTPKPMGRDVLDVPFHVALNHVQAWLNKLSFAPGVHTLARK